MTRILWAITVLSVSFVACNSSSEFIEFYNAYELRNGLLLTSDHSQEEEVHTVKNFKELKNGLDSIPCSPSSEIIIFPYGARPAEKVECQLVIEKIKKIPFKLYFDASYRSLLSGQHFENQMDVMNSILKGFQNGFEFILQDKIEITEYQLTSNVGDHIFQDLEKRGIIDSTYTWHLFLLGKNANLGGSAAFHSKTFDNHLIISNDFLINNPVGLLHEFMHGFSGHVDLELNNPTYNDPQKVAQNIMFNYNLPKIPRYSLYQNMQANNFSSSTYRGINIFPIAPSIKLQEWNSTNKKLPIDGNSTLISLVHPIHEHDRKYEDYIFSLLNDPIENYLLHLDKGINSYPELINCKSLSALENYKLNKGQIDENWLKMLELESHYLEINGLRNPERFHNDRILHYKEMRIKKLNAWQDAISTCSEAANK